MNLDNLKKYLENKEHKNFLEKMTLEALRSDELLSATDNFSYLQDYSNLSSVIQSPMNYDKPGYYRYYNNALVQIVNAYTAYNFDTKTKFTNFNKEISNLDKKITEANDAIDKIKDTSEIISGAEVLSAYAKEFDERAKEYRKNARTWEKRLYISIAIFTLVVICMLFLNLFKLEWFEKYLSKEIVHFGYAAIIFVKVIIITIIIQIIRFFNRNYNANKHLEIQSLHKRDVLKSLQGAYNTLDVDQKDLRNELIKSGAITAFQNIESGYITVKEGAGGGESGLLSIVANIFRR